MTPMRLAKVDADLRVVYGWAGIITRADGTLIEDLQGDLITPAEMEQAGIDFMLHFRESGVMHEGEPVATVIAWFVTTPELVQAFGLGDHVPCGVMMGIKVHDDTTWARVKAGDLSMFSIEGLAERVEVG